MIESSSIYPFVALLHREISRFAKVIVQTIFTPVITSSLYLLIFGLSLGAAIPKIQGSSYLVFLIPGLVMMGCLNNAFQNSSSSIVAAKFSGDLQDLKVTPLSVHHILWAMGLGGLARGVLVGSITYTIGNVFVYFQEHSTLVPSHWILLLFFLCAGGLSFSWLGLSVAFWAKTFDQLSAIGTFVLTPLLYLGGVFFSVEGLHPFWVKIAHLNPLFHFIHGVRYGLLGSSDSDLRISGAVAILTMFSMYLLAFRSLKFGSYNRW